METAAIFIVIGTVCESGNIRVRRVVHNRENVDITNVFGERRICAVAQLASTAEKSIFSSFGMAVFVCVWIFGGCSADLGLYSGIYCCGSVPGK